MYGDYAPTLPISELLSEYKNLYLYADDAHGMSWYGKNGKGYILSKIVKHQKVVVATSFAKAFGVGGGVFVFPNEEMFQKVKNCGGPFIFSGPHQVPVLGAAIASAKIHLSEEIYTLQKNLAERINYCHSLLKAYNLPVISSPDTPIFFVGLGLLRVGYNLVKKMIDHGFYVNISAFPAVPETCTGLRFTITLHHSLQDIEMMVKALAINFKQTLSEEERTTYDVHRSFKRIISFDEEISIKSTKKKSEIDKRKYTIEHQNTIRNIDQKLWDELLGKGSSFDWNGLRFLEDIFKNNNEIHNNWEFHYYVIKDDQNKPVLATYFTISLLKDDMLTAKSVSQKIESERKHNPYYLTSISMMMGCPLSLGNHLYLDRSSPGWKKYLMLLIDTVWKEQENKNANLNFRDFDPEDKEICDFFIEQGFLQIVLPETHILENPSWKSETEYLKRFSGKRRYNLKQEVFKHEEEFCIKILQDKEEANIPEYYKLYNNVVEKSFEVSSFKLPYKLFENMLKCPQWEVIELRLKNNENQKTGKIIGVNFCYKTKESYEFLFVGIDYDYIDSHNIYKQAIWRAISRSNLLQLGKINLGVTASISKRKFGAKPVKNVAFIQMKDNFNMNLIEIMSNTKISVKQ